MKLLVFALYVIIIVTGLLTMVRGSMDGDKTCKDIGLVTLLICIMAGIIMISIAIL